MAKKEADYIERLMTEGRNLPSKKPKHKLTVTIDHELWLKSRPHLDGKYGALLEGAIAEYLERLKNGPS